MRKRKSHKAFAHFFERSSRPQAFLPFSFSFLHQRSPSLFPPLRAPREGTEEWPKMCSLEKVGGFEQHRREEERWKDEEVDGPSTRQRRRCFFDVRRSTSKIGERRKKLSPLFFSLSPPSHPLSQLLIKGIRSFSPENEVKGGGVVGVLGSHLPFPSSFSLSRVIFFNV